MKRGRKLAIACLLTVQTFNGSYAARPGQVTDETKTANGGNLPALFGKSAPSFAVSTLDGRWVSFADYKGKGLIVNFWATWCGDCKLEMPWLAQLREQYAKQGFEVLGIVTDAASNDKVKQIADKYGVKYPILRCNHKTAQAYGGLPYLPESFYISRSGKVVLEAADASSKANIEADIRKTLASK